MAKNKLNTSLNINIIIIFFLLIGLVVLLLLIASSPNLIVADERFFLPNLLVYKKYGLSFDFLRNMRDQSPGPLYQAIYTPLSNFISLTPKILRYFNFIFLLFNICLLYVLLTTEKIKNAFLICLLFLAIPMAWDIGGMAFTEMPAIFFCLLSIIILRKAILSPAKFSIPIAAIAGLTAGISVMGRTPFLMIIPASFLLFNISGKKLEITFFILCSMIFPCIVFYVWKGLVPLDVQGIQSGYNFSYIFLCFTYFAISVLIIYPELYKIDKKHYIIASAIIIIAFILNFFFFKISYMPMNGAIQPKNLPKSIMVFYPYIFEAFSIGISYIFIVAIVNHAKKSQSTLKWFYLAFCFLIAFTTIKSAAHFSSRYIMQAYPIFILYIASEIKINKYLLLRCIVGTIIGIISLESYYTIWKQYNIHFTM